MGPDIKKTFFFSLLFIAFILSACSNSVTELKSSSVGVIFDYQNETDLPSVHLSVFAEPGTNVRRCKELKLISKDTLYEWTTEVILKYQFNNRYFAGYTNFVMPEGEKIPSGRYEIKYTEFDGKKCSVNTRLRYNSDFYQMNSKSAEEIINSGKYEKKLAIYDGNHVLLYFGELNSEHKNNSNIINRYKGAETKRIVWVSSDKTICCLMPPEKLNNNTNKEE